MENQKLFLVLIASDDAKHLVYGVSAEDAENKFLVRFDSLLSEDSLGELEVYEVVFNDGIAEIDV